MTIVNNNINPMTDVTLENGKINRLKKKFKYEKKIPDKETIFQLQLETASIF
jgi:hypothetical protein